MNPILKLLGANFRRMLVMVCVFALVSGNILAYKPFVQSAQPQSGEQSASPTFPDPGKASMSKEKQQALGMEVAAQVYQKMPVLPDNSPESQYVRQLGQKLVATIPQQYSWPFEFHVIPQKEINAFALPGGQMFINLGTIIAAKNEAELAGVMGHEMAHVYMQHSAKQAGKAQTTSTIAGITSAVLGGAGGASRATWADGNSNGGPRPNDEVLSERRIAGRHSWRRDPLQCRLQPAGHG